MKKELGPVGQKVLQKINDKMDALTKEKALVEKYVGIFDALGLDFSIVSADRNPFLTVSASSFSDVAGIIKSIPPSGKPGEIGFAGEKSIISKSPFLIKVSNYEHAKTKEAIVVYASEIPIWIECDVDWFETKDETVELRDKKLAQALYGTTRLSQTLVTLGTVQRFGSGGDMNHFTSYAANEGEAARFYEVLGVPDLYKCPEALFVDKNDMQDVSESYALKR